MYAYIQKYVSEICGLHRTHKLKVSTNRTTKRNVNLSEHVVVSRFFFGQNHLQFYFCVIFIIRVEFDLWNDRLNMIGINRSNFMIYELFIERCMH